MAERDFLDEDYLTVQFSAVQHRIAQDDRKRRRHRLAWVGCGVAASLALTGGAVVVVQATGARTAVSTCFESASLGARSGEVGDGGMAASNMPARVAKAEEQCTVVWRLNTFNPQSDLKTEHPVPDLFTCVLADGRLGVFPVDGKATCAALHLREP